MKKLCETTNLLEWQESNVFTGLDKFKFVHLQNTYLQTSGSMTFGTQCSCFQCSSLLLRLLLTTYNTIQCQNPEHYIVQIFTVWKPQISLKRSCLNRYVLRLMTWLFRYKFCQVMLIHWQYRWHTHALAFALNKFRLYKISYFSVFIGVRLCSSWFQQLLLYNLRMKFYFSAIACAGTVTCRVLSHERGVERYLFHCLCVYIVA
jgi:hypothetical protein